MKKKKKIEWKTTISNEKWEEETTWEHAAYEQCVDQALSVCVVFIIGMDIVLWAKIRVSAKRSSIYVAMIYAIEPHYTFPK